MSFPRSADYLPTWPQVMDLNKIHKLKRQLRDWKRRAKVAEARLAAAGLD